MEYLRPTIPLPTGWEEEFVKFFVWERSVFARKLAASYHMAGYFASVYPHLGLPSTLPFYLAK